MVIKHRFLESNRIGKNLVATSKITTINHHHSYITRSHSYTSDPLENGVELP